MPGKIIDFFTRKAMEQKDVPRVYLGSLPDESAQQLRMNMDRLMTDYTHLQALIREWEVAYIAHLATTEAAFVHHGLLATDITIAIADTFIDEKGHVFWEDRGQGYVH